MADPLLQGRYPMRGLYQALAVAAMCLQERASTRPLIGDVVTALTYLASQTYNPNTASAHRTRDRHRSRSEALDSPDNYGRSARRGSPSSHKNSPDLRKKSHIRESSTGAELGRIDTYGSTGNRWGLDEPERAESQKDSLMHNARASETPNHWDLDRERAVAEAKLWGENLRDKKRANTIASTDGMYE